MVCVGVCKYMYININIYLYIYIYLGIYLPIYSIPLHLASGISEALQLSELTPNRKSHPEFEEANLEGHVDTCEKSKVEANQTHKTHIHHFQKTILEKLQIS